MTTQISKRQNEALQSIAALIRQRGFPPSYLDIAELMGIKSTFGVRKHLDALQARGLINRIPGGARTIQITELGLLTLGSA